jgi:hypothetical protein
VERASDLGIRFSRVLSHLTPGQQGLVLHSLVRRSGIKTTLRYRQRLSQLIEATMYKLDGFSRGLSYSADNDWVEFYERSFTPHIAVRPWVLQRYGITVRDSDGFAGWPKGIPKKSSLLWKDEADILLEAGLETGFRGEMERAQTILEAALRLATKKRRHALMIRSAEALAWVHLRLSRLGDSDRHHAHYLRAVEPMIRDLRPAAVRSAGCARSARGFRSAGPAEQAL